MVRLHVFGLEHGQFRYVGLWLMKLYFHIFFFMIKKRLLTIAKKSYRMEPRIVCSEVFRNRVKQ